MGLRDKLLGVSTTKAQQFVALEEKIKGSNDRPSGRDAADYQRLQNEIPNNQQNEARRRFGS